MKSVYIDRTGDWVESENDTGKFCLRSEVDKTVAELELKLHDAEMRADLAEAAETERKIDYENLKKDLAYHARQIYFKHNRQTLRALWLARAYRAEAIKNYWYTRSCHEGDKYLWSIDGSAVKYIGCIKRTNFDWLKVWSEVETKCLAKADTFKEAK